MCKYKIIREIQAAMKYFIIGSFLKLSINNRRAGIFFFLLLKKIFAFYFLTFSHKCLGEFLCRSAFSLVAVHCLQVHSFFLSPVLCCLTAFSRFAILSIKSLQQLCGWQDVA